MAIEHLGVKYSDFVVPECPDCLLEDHRNSVVRILCLLRQDGKKLTFSQLKPEVIFFGESIPGHIKEQS